MNCWAENGDIFAASRVVLPHLYGGCLFCHELTPPARVQEEALSDGNTESWGSEALIGGVEALGTFNRRRNPYDLRVLLPRALVSRRCPSHMAASGGVADECAITRLHRVLA